MQVKRLDPPKPPPPTFEIHLDRPEALALYRLLKVVATADIVVDHDRAAEDLADNIMVELSGALSNG